MKKYRQQRALFGYFILAYLVIVVVFSFFRYQSESQRLDGIIRDRLQNGAAMVKYVMPRGYFDRAVSRESIHQADYNSYTDLLSQAAWENNFHFLFALREKEGRFYYIAYSLSRKEQSDKRYAAYWKEYTEVQPDLIRAHKTRKAAFTKLTDSYGTYYTVFQPEYSPSGEFFITGADYDFQNMKASLNRIFAGAALQALTLLLLLFLIYFTLTRLQKHYVRRLQFSNAVNEASPIGVMSLQPDGRIDYVNQVFAGLVGVKLENLDDRSIHDDLGFNKDDELVNRIRICLLRQISWQGEFLNANPAGREYWVNANINYILPVQEGKAMINVYAADVTPQMRSRISLSQHNTALRFISRAIHILLANHELDNTLPEVMALYGQSLGKSQVAILRSSFSSYDIHACWQSSASADNGIPVNLFSQAGKQLNSDWETCLRQGQVVSGESYDFPISLITLARVQSPGILHLAPVFCDDKYWGLLITLQSQREETLDDELEKTVLLSIADSIGSALRRSETDTALRRSLDTKTGFMSSMSHEIRTPLNGVIGMINLLESTPLSTEQKDFVEAMKSSGKLLMNLINNILDITRIEAGKSLLRSDPFSLISCVRTAVNIVDYELREKQLTLELTFDPKLPKVVQGDETRLKQVIVNLLHNAIKFTDKGRIKLHVERLSANRMQFTVADTGIGMAPDHLRHIFEPFYQAGPLAQRMKGTGLGLAISKQLVELMNGSIKIISEQNVGTTVTFTVELPVLEDIVEYYGREPESGLAPAAAELPPLSALQTACLAGHDMDDRILQSFLLSKGYNHVTTDTWEDLLSLMQKEEMLLAIVNLPDDAPGRDQLIRSIRQAYRDRPDKFWLVLTAKSAGEILDPTRPANNVQCLPKPLDFDQTLFYLQSVFGKEPPAGPVAQAELKLEER